MTDAMTKDFAQFLKTREQASAAYIEGDAAPLAALATRTDPASFMPPSGAVVTGAAAVRNAHAEGAKPFRTGSRGRFEIIQSGSSGELGFWTAVHHADMAIAGHDQPVAMALRTTEIFRREDGAWKLAHRHAEFARQDAAQHTRTRAKATITVHRFEAKPYDESENPALLDVRLSETFAGDIAGESDVRALQVRRDDGTASMVSMQRFRGKVGGRRGTFVLQGKETVANGKITATWSVVPHSGTGDLAGLRGEGGFAGELGKGSEGSLDYWFE
jgi:ketosteroid isomerase-like protein